MIKKVGGIVHEWGGLKAGIGWPGRGRVGQGRCCGTRGHAVVCWVRRGEDKEFTCQGESMSISKDVVLRWP
jgi:hypothetical protein